MAVNKIDPKVIFASEAPAQDTPAVFTNRTVGWGETRKNGGRPTIKQMNAEQQSTDLKILWLNENAVTPYDPTIDYPLDAVTIKDGIFKIFDGSVWKVFLDKTDIGLGNVDNTSDLNKPVSVETQAALDLKADKSYIDNSLPHNNLINRNSSGAHEAVAILSNGGENQQQINDRGGSTWYEKSGGYNLNDRVILDNGDIVRSTVANNTIDPNVDMTGWVKTNSTSQIFDKSGLSQQEWNNGVESIADLLAITKAENGSRVYVRGAQGGYFVFNQARVSDNDGGTVFNGWERVNFDHIDFAMFGCDPLGLINAQSKIRAAYIASDLLKKPVINNSGVYLLNDSSVINVKQNSDTSGTIFKLGSSYAGSIRVGFDCNYQDVISGALFDAVKSLPPAQKGSKYLEGITNVLKNKYFAITTNLPTHLYRGELQTHVEFNRAMVNNRVESGFLFDFNFSTMTKLNVQDVRSGVLTVRGITIDETQLPQSITATNNFVIIANTNNVKFENYRVITDDVVNSSRNRLLIYNAFDCSVDDYLCPENPEDTERQSSYSISYGTSYNLQLSNIRSHGSGWASTGGNLSRKITYRNCRLSRVDNHTPFQEYLKIKDSVIAMRGISGTGMGDLYVSDTEFYSDLAVSVGYMDGASFIVTNRTDGGGFYDGDLIMSNIKLTGIINPATADYYSLAFCQGAAADSAMKPEGSPIDFRFFKSIRINGVSCDISGISILNLLLSYQAADKLTLLPPTSVNIKNLYDNIELLKIEVNKFKQATYKINLNLSNMNCETFSFFTDYGYGVNNKVKAIVSNIHSDNSGFVRIQNRTDGDFTFRDCDIVRYQEIGANKPTVRILDSRYKLEAVNSGFIEGAENSKSRVFLRNVVASSTGNGIYANTYKNQLCNVNAKDICIDGNTSALSRVFLSSNTTTNSTTFGLPPYGFVKLRTVFGVSPNISYIDSVINLSSTNTFTHDGIGYAVTVTGSVASVVVSVSQIREVFVIESF